MIILNIDDDQGVQSGNHPEEVFIDTLIRYLGSRGYVILSLLEASGGDYLKIELRGLRRYFRREFGYERFDEAYEDLRKNTRVLNVMGGRIELYEDYVLITKDLLVNLINSIKRK